MYVCNVHMWAPGWFFCVSVTRLFCEDREDISSMLQIHVKEENREGENKDKMKGGKERRIIQNPEDVDFSQFKKRAKGQACLLGPVILATGKADMSG